MTDYIKFGN